MIRKMEASTFLKQSSNPSGFLVIFVKKTDGSTFFCVDYRKLNDFTQKVSSLSRTDDSLAIMSGLNELSTLDLKAGTAGGETLA